MFKRVVQVVEHPKNFKKELSRVKTCLKCGKVSRATIG